MVRRGSRVRFSWAAPRKIARNEASSYFTWDVATQSLYVPARNHVAQPCKRSAPTRLSQRLPSDAKLKHLSDISNQKIAKTSYKISLLGDRNETLSREITQVFGYALILPCKDLATSSAVRNSMPSSAKVL